VNYKLPYCKKLFRRHLAKWGVGRPVAVVEPAPPERLNFDNRKFCDHCHSRETRYTLYKFHI
jgi:hypothetical protein